MAGKKKVFMARRITPALFIRQHLLAMTTTEFADALGVTKTCVSRYDQHGSIPEAHHRTVRKLAAARKVTIKAGWFEKVPFQAGVPT